MNATRVLLLALVLTTALVAAPCAPIGGASAACVENCRETEEGVCFTANVPPAALVQCGRRVLG